jgi:hypothetical protein
MIARAIFLLAILGGSGTAWAQDRFEIQVYDAETAPRHGYGLETHANAVLSSPREGHLTFEPHFGVTSWAEAGGYLQTALTNDGSFAYAGAKLRTKLRLPRRVWGDRIGLAVNGELSAIPARFEPARYGSEVRPIVDLRAGRFYAAVNPIVTIDLAGSDAGHPAFEPCAKASWIVGGKIALGAEWYGAFGSHVVDRLLAALDWSGSWIDVNAGAGYAWGGDGWVVKVIVGIHPR